MEKSGKVRLNRNKLISLRKNKGLSQEQLADACLESGLYVSLSSLKRAETRKSILLRTAHDLAEFYHLDMVSLIEADTEISNTTEPPKVADTSIKKTLPSPSTKLTLMCVQYKSDMLSLEKIQAIIHQFHGCCCPIETPGRLIALFGSQQFEEKLYEQAIECALRLRTAVNETAKSENTYHDLKIALSLFLPVATNTPLKLLSVEGWREQGFQIPLNARVESQVLLEQQTTACILVHHRIYKSVSSDYEAIALPAKQIKPRWWQLQGRRVLPKHFVGREQQVLCIEQACQQLVSRSVGNWIYISGVAGIGKTQLLKVAQQYLGNKDARVISSHLLKYGEMDVSTSAAKLLKHLLLDNNESNMEVTSQKLNSLELSTSILPFLRRLLGLPLNNLEQRLFQSMQPKGMRQQSIEALNQFFEQVLKDYPTCLLIEDLHWADNDMSMLLESLASTCQILPCLVITTSRPEGPFYPQPQWLSCSQTVTLAPFTQQECLHLATIMAISDEKRVNRSISLSNGHPLFFKELLISQETEIPDSIFNIVVSKSQHLGQREIQTLSLAAVLGQRFTKAQLAEILGEDSVSLQQAKENELLLQQGHWFLFSHELIRKAVYDQIPNQSCMALHEQCAGYYQSIGNKEYYAEHLIAAGSSEATDAVCDASRELEQAFRFERALQLIDRCLNMLSSTQQQNKCHSLLYEKGNILLALGKPGNSAQCYQDAINTCEDESLAAKYWLALSLPYRLLEQTSDAVMALKSSEMLAQASGSLDVLSRVYNMRGNLLFPTGQLTESESWQQRALETAIKSADKYAHCKALSGLGDCAYAQGKMTTAFRVISQCIELAEKENFLDIESANRFMLGTVRIYHLQTREALADAQQSAFLAHQTGEQRAEIVSRLTAGWILLDMTRNQEACQEIDTALKMARQLSASRFVAFLLESKARCYWQTGDSDNAHKAIQEALDITREDGFQAFIGPWITATAALVSPDINSANAHLQQGQQWIEDGCVGHSHFRFYQLAMEAMWRFKQTDKLLQLAELLKNYMAKEPNPWGQLFIDRAQLLARCLQKSPNLQPDIDKLNQRITQAQLNIALIPPM